MEVARARPWTLRVRREGFDYPETWCGGYAAIVDVAARYLDGVELPPDRRGVVIAGIRCKGQPRFVRTERPERPPDVVMTLLVVRRACADGDGDGDGDGDDVQITESSNPFRDLIRLVQAGDDEAEGVVVYATRPPLRGRARRGGPRFGTWRILAYARADAV